jgi:hypothetical protein
MRKFLVLMILGCAVMARAQVIGVNPTPVGNYFWNTSTNEFDVCPNSSTAEPFASTPQAFANYGFNGSLGQWTPATACPGTGSGSGLTSFQGRTATAAVLLLSDVNPVLKTATNCNVAGGLVYSPFSNSCIAVSDFTSENPNLFFSGPCSGAATTPAFRVMCSGDFNAALTADSNFSIVAESLAVTGPLAFHTDCSAINNAAFSINLISNGSFTGPELATTTVAGVCPSESAYSLGNWAAEVLAVEQGGGLFFSNCGLDVQCIGTSPALSQSMVAMPTAPSGGCPNVPFPGPTNQPVWALVAVGTDGGPHIYTCSNQASSTWILFH